MQQIQLDYIDLTQRIDKQRIHLLNSGCYLRNIYLGETEYKLLRLQLSQNHSFSVIYPPPPEPPFEMFCGMRVHLVYDRAHLEITWDSAFQKHLAE